jgi:hypothetical protein
MDIQASSGREFERLNVPLEEAELHCILFETMDELA